MEHVSFSVRMPAAIRDALDELAEREQRSRNQVTVLLLASALGQEPTPRGKRPPAPPSDDSAAPAHSAAPACRATSAR